MFSAVQAFISRHQRKFIVGGIVIGGVVLISDYAKRVLREAQEKETREILERNRKHLHYEGTEEMCNKTALTTVQTLSTAICQELNTENILSSLKKGSVRKVYFWEKLMVLSFTKAIVMVYASSLMMILLRVQLNLIGGYIFRDSADGTKHLDGESQRKYLSLFNKLVENGIHQLITLFKPKFKKLLENKSLRDDLTIKDIEKIFWAIQSSVSTDLRDPCKDVARYCLPDPPKKNQGTNNHKPDLFDRMIEETRDILESGEVQELMQSAVVSGFALVMDELSDNFRTKYNALKSQKSESDSTVASTSSDASPPPSVNRDELVDLSAVSLPMARVIPMVNDLVPEVYKSNGFVDSLMYKLILMEPLKVMGANVYETFSSNI